jgi:uncharacterized membrane protein HdeD (DUF308 family)
MKDSNIAVMHRVRKMCLLYGIISLVLGLINFTEHEYGMGMILVTIAILGFWRISHKVKGVALDETVK